jgi:hypothetical protein
MDVQVSRHTIAVDLHLPRFVYIEQFDGFVRRGPKELDVLLRRAEPWPAAVDIPAGPCYDLSFQLVADPGRYNIRIFYYHFKEGQAASPTEIASSEAIVPN